MKEPNIPQVLQYSAFAFICLRSYYILEEFLLAIMCYTNDVNLNPNVAISLSVFLGCAVTCCVFANIRLIWLGMNGSSQFNRDLHLSPYLVSCCCADSAMVFIFGPFLCILFIRDNWVINDTVCAVFDILFLALFGITTISLLLYNLDRHCLLVERRFYPSTFGKRKRNAINLVIAWISTTLLSISYLHNRTSLPSQYVPMTFQLSANMLYCVFTTLILYLVPVLIIMASLIKTVVHVRVRSSHFRRTDTLHDRDILPGILQEELQTHTGVMVSSAVFVLTSMPWVLFQMIKSLGLSNSLSAVDEIVLVAVLVVGVGMKTLAYIACCSFIRKRFFVNVFRNNTFDFELPQSPVVVINTEAV